MWSEGNYLDAWNDCRHWHCLFDINDWSHRNTKSVTNLKCEYESTYLGLSFFLLITCNTKHTFQTKQWMPIWMIHNLAKTEETDTHHPKNKKTPKKCNLIWIQNPNKRQTKTRNDIIIISPRKNRKRRGKIMVEREREQCIIQEGWSQWPQQEKWLWRCWKGRVHLNGPPSWVI